MLTTNSIVKLSQDQVSSEFMDGELVILNLKDGVYYGLDPIGARVWNLLQSPESIAKIRDLLVAEYNVDRATCESDLLDLLADLEKYNLLEVS